MATTAIALTQQFQIPFTHIDSVEYRQILVHIYDQVDPNNENQQKERVYYYSPLSLIDVNSVKVNRNPFTNQCEVIFNVEMWNEEIQEKVTSRVKEKQRITPVSSNRVQVLPYEEVMLICSMTIADFRIDYTRKLTDQMYKFLTFNLTCPSKEKANKVAQNIRDHPEDFSRCLKLFIRLLSSSVKKKSQPRQIKNKDLISHSIIASKLIKTSLYKPEILMPNDETEKLLIELANISTETYEEIGDAQRQYYPINPYEILKQMLVISREKIDRRNVPCWESVFWENENSRPDHVCHRLNEMKQQLSPKYLEKLITSNFLDRENPDHPLHYLIEKLCKDFEENKNHIEFDLDGGKFVPKPMDLNRINLRLIDSGQVFEILREIASCVINSICLPINTPLKKKSGNKKIRGETTDTRSDSVIRIVGKHLRYNPEELLGRGAYGTMVFAGFYKDGDKEKKVAVKRVLRSHINLKSEFLKKMVKSVLNDNKNGKKGQENILCYLTSELDEDFLYIVTEHCAGTLQNFVEGDYKGPPLTDEKDVLYQVTQGLSYLHRIKIIHRDIKPSNALIYIQTNTLSTQIKLADFGICSTLIEDSREFVKMEERNPYGTQGWLAPELFDPKRGKVPDYPVDIFALGLLFSYVLTVGGKHPFGDGPLLQYIRILNNEPMVLVRDDLKEAFRSTEAYDLIKDMVDMQPECRPSVDKVLGNDLFCNSPRINRDPEDVLKEVVKYGLQLNIARTIQLLYFLAETGKFGDYYISLLRQDIYKLDIFFRRLKYLIDKANKLLKDNPNFIRFIEKIWNVLRHNMNFVLVDDATDFVFQRLLNDDFPLDSVTTHIFLNVLSRLPKSTRLIAIQAVASVASGALSSPYIDDDINIHAVEPFISGTKSGVEKSDQVELLPVLLDYDVLKIIRDWWKGGSDVVKRNPGPISDSKSSFSVKDLPSHGFDIPFTFGEAIATQLIIGAASAAAAVASGGAAIAASVASGGVAAVATHVRGKKMASTQDQHWSYWVSKNLFELSHDEALENAFRFLGLSPDASNREINEAFQRLSFIYQLQTESKYNEACWLQLQYSMAVVKVSKEFIKECTIPFHQHQRFVGHGFIPSKLEEHIHPEPRPEPFLARALNVGSPFNQHFYGSLMSEYLGSVKTLGDAFSAPMSVPLLNKSMIKSMEKGTLSKKSAIQPNQLKLQEIELSVLATDKKGIGIQTTRSNLSLLCQNDPFPETDLCTLRSILNGLKERNEKPQSHHLDGTNSLFWLFQHQRTESLLDIVKLMLDVGMDPNAKDSNGRTTLHSLCDNYRNKDLFDIIKLMMKKWDVNYLNAQDSTGSAAIHWLCENYPCDNMKGIIELLIEGGADVNVKDSNGSTVLHRLSANYSQENIIDVADFLIKKGVDLNATWGPRGDSIIHAFCENYKKEDLIEIIKLLVNNRANVTKKNTEGDTAMDYICACYRNENLLEIIKYMIDKGVDIKRSKNSGGRTALHRICKNYCYDNLYDIIKLLVNEKGLDVTIEDDDGFTALDCLRKNSCFENLKNVIGLLNASEEV